LKRMNKGNFLSYTLDKLIEVQVKTKVKHI